MADPEQIDFYDNFVGHFDSQKNNARNAAFRQFLGRWIRQGQTVLDFGCALGYNTGPLLNEGCAVVGIDLSPKCVHIAGERYPGGQWYSGDITDGFDPGHRDFDWIVMSDVIEHVPLERHTQLFERLGSWSKPGTCIIGSVPDPMIHDAVVKSMTKQPVEERVEIDQLLMRMRAAGFGRVITLYLDGGIYYRFVVRRPAGKQAEEVQS